MWDGAWAPTLIHPDAYVEVPPPGKGFLERNSIPWEETAKALFGHLPELEDDGE